MLVVFGHLVAKGTPQGYEWYGAAKTAIYDFHMPLFMYLSGFVFFFADLHRRSWPGYPSFITARAARLILPFVGFGAIIVLGKYFTQFVIHVDDPPAGIISGLLELFFNTARSPALSIWYIWVLFIYSAATPLLWRALGGRIFVLGIVAATAVLLRLPVVDHLYLDRVVRFAPFFLLGGAAALAGERYLEALDRFRWVALTLFIVSFPLTRDWPASSRLILVGAISIPAIHGALRARPFHRDQWLLWLGLNSFIIYLLNTIVIGVLRGAGAIVLPFSGPAIWLYLPLLFAAGLLAPIAIRQIAFRPIPPLYDLTR